MIDVAERGVAVLGNSAGGYERCVARWGGTDPVLAAATAGHPPTGLDGPEWRPDGAYESFEAVVAGLDYLGTAALYRIDSAGVAAFLPVWFGLPLAETVGAPTAGALLAVESLAEARTLRARVRELKGSIVDAVEAGRLPAAAAPLAVWAAVGTLEGRERYVAPPFPPLDRER